MSGRNGEGYPDPTAETAIRNLTHMPKHVKEAYKTLEEAAGLMGFEIIGLRDRKTRKEWRR